MAQQDSATARSPKRPIEERSYVAPATYEYDTAVVCERFQGALVADLFFYLSRRYYPAVALHYTSGVTPTGMMALGTGLTAAGQTIFFNTYIAVAMVGNSYYENSKIEMKTVATIISHSI